MKYFYPIYWNERDSSKSGYINEFGRLIYEFDFQSITHVHEGLAYYTKGERWGKGFKWGLMSNDGIEITSPTFSSVRPFENGLSIVALNEPADLSFQVGYIERSGNWRIRPQYSAAAPFSEGVAYVCPIAGSGLFSLIDSSGDVLIPDISISPQRVGSGLAKSFDSETRCFGYRNLNGEWVVEPSFSTAGDFRENIAAVFRTSEGVEELCFIDRSGEVVVDASGYTNYETGFSEGLVCVYRESEGSGELACYIDRSGHEVVSPNWLLGTPFKAGLAAVKDKTNGKWGAISAGGEVAISAEYSTLEVLDEHLVAVRRIKKFGPTDYLNHKGDIIWRHGMNPKV